MDTRGHNITLAITTVVLGVVVGCSSLLLSVLLDLTERLFLHFSESVTVPVNIMATPAQRLLSVLAGGIIAAIIWYLLQRHYHPVSIARAIAGDRMPLGKTIVHVCTQIFFVGTGNSIGRELAPREAGAAIAQKWAQSWGKRLSAEDQKLLVAAAAGAGFAGVYIAPLTGAIFCLELLYKKVTARAVAVSLTMSVIATVIGALVKGYGPYYLVSNRHFILQLLPLTVGLGIINGLAGTLFKLGVKAASKHRATTRNVLLQLPLLSLLAGIVASFYPQVMGNGRGLAQMAMNASTGSQHVILLLSFGLVAKVAITLATIRCGGYGGILTPSIAAGSVIGIFAGLGYGAFVPGIALSQLAVLGAASFLAASQQAPLMAMCMLFEVCHLNYTALLPLALDVALSIATSKLIEKRFAY